MACPLTVSLDKFELMMLLESAFRGSHLRTGVIERFINDFYDHFTDVEREFFYNTVLEQIYDGEFQPWNSLCGYDKWFMARYNPDNQYMVTADYNGSTFTSCCFKYTDEPYGDGQEAKEHYYTSVRKYINEDYITKVEKI